MDNAKIKVTSNLILLGLKRNKLKIESQFIINLTDCPTQRENPGMPADTMSITRPAKALRDRFFRPEEITLIFFGCTCSSFGLFLLPTSLPLRFLARETIAPFIDGRANKGNNVSMTQWCRAIKKYRVISIMMCEGRGRQASAMAFGKWFATTSYYFFVRV